MVVVVAMTMLDNQDERWGWMEAKTEFGDGKERRWRDPLEMEAGHEEREEEEDVSTRQP